MTLTPLTIRRLNAAVVHLAGGHHALVDESDWSIVSGYNWHFDAANDIVRSQTRGEPKMRRVVMHRLVSGVSGRVKHANGNHRDNRRANLLTVTRRQSQQGARVYRRRGGKSSRFKGVSWEGRRQRWAAYIRVDGVQHFLGYYRSEAVAAERYDAAALKHFGEFARLNFTTTAA
jgi:hypothetical protein